MTDPSSFLQGALCGLIISGVVRFSIGRLIIREEGRWVWRFSRFDEREQEVRDLVDRAREIGVGRERARVYVAAHAKYGRERANELGRDLGLMPEPEATMACAGLWCETEIDGRIRKTAIDQDDFAALDMPGEKRARALTDRR